MTRDLSKLLADYVENKLDPETEIEIDGLILLYVDGELDSERAAEIKVAMDANPTVAASIEHSMRAAKTVQEQLTPAEIGIGELPPDPAHDQWLADLIADPNAWGKAPEEGDEPSGVVVPLQARPADEQRPVRQPAAAQPTWGALAASIAVLLALGGGAYVYDRDRDMRREEQIAALDTELQQLGEERRADAIESDRLTRQVTALGIQLGEATTARDEVRNQLAEAETAIDALKADQAGLTAELAAANEEVATAEAARDDLQEQIASLDAQTRQEIESSVNEREALARRLAATETRLEEATTARDSATRQLAEAGTTIDTLTADRTELTEQLTAANDTITAAEAARDGLEQQIAALDAEISQTTAERNTLTDQVSALETRLAAAETSRDGLDAQLTDARAAIDALDKDKANLASQVAELDDRISEMDTELAAALVARETAETQLSVAAGESRERIGALEEELGQAQADITGLRQAGNLLLAEAERLRREASWVGQVVAYHRFYAGSPREVEGSDKATLSEQALIKWFNNKLGRPFPVPDLEGFTYVGGRVYPINGAPTALIGYHDQSGRLTALCFSPAPGNQTTELVKGEDGDLNLVYWEKGGFRYVLVGETGFDLLEPLAGELRQTYGEDT